MRDEAPPVGRGASVLGGQLGVGVFVFATLLVFVALVFSGAGVGVVGVVGVVLLPLSRVGVVGIGDSKSKRDPLQRGVPQHPKRARAGQLGARGRPGGEVTLPLWFWFWFRLGGGGGFGDGCGGGGGLGLDLAYLLYRRRCGCGFELSPALNARGIKRIRRVPGQRLHLDARRGPRRAPLRLVPYIPL
ncbi:hypothetical protein B0H16DRAFT_1537605 [Mycena metata]|uniref:Uncharacterized protein n=1 Tax=Mycena metata TaxID=1033252 RepID=A0AAD7J4U0_9AGAR|nr:hypothetical protein B0H16DRAFT_1537605 [Mycena metata]